MSKTQIEKSISYKEKKVKELQEMIVQLNIGIKNDQKELAKAKELEKQEKEKKFFKKYGVLDYDKNNPETNRLVNRLFILFNKEAQFVRVSNLKDFASYSDFEKSLKEEKLYGHALTSFQLRSTEFYDWDLKDQLVNLDWNLNSDGTIDGDW